MSTVDRSSPQLSLLVEPTLVRQKVSTSTERSTFESYGTRNINETDIEDIDLSQLDVKRSAASQHLSVSARQEELYPHLFSSSDAAIVTTSYRSAVEHLQVALDGFREGDLVGVASALESAGGDIAAAIQSGHATRGFLGLSLFIRRALLSAGADEVSQSSLNLMQSCLRNISERPVMSLDEASAYTERLEASGWFGSNEFVEKLAKSLIEEYATEDDVVHAGD